MRGEKNSKKTPKTSAFKTGPELILSSVLQDIINVSINVRRSPHLQRTFIKLSLFSLNPL